MSDYSFMKSGFDNLVEKEEDFEKNVTAILLHFMENAMRSAGIYVEHCKRNAVTPEDIKRSLMLEIFLFTKRIDLKSEIVKILNELDKHSSDEEDYSDDEDFICPEAEVMEFKTSECDCAMCKCLNNIYDRWNGWTPQSSIEHIMKKHIDNM